MRAVVIRQVTAMRLPDRLPGDGLSRFDRGVVRPVDPVVVRFALVYWSNNVDQFTGELFPRWEIYRMGNHRSENDLLTIGLLLFGPSPWRRACVVCAQGVLGTLEKLVGSMPEPDKDFRFDFSVV